MGSRGRSIRLRIYFLVAIPLVALVGLLAYVAGTAINNAISLDRAPNLVNATAVPAAKFGTYLQAERAAAVVYLFQPTAANLAAYDAATAATDRAEPAFIAAMNSQGTTGTENSTGAKAVSSLVTGLSQLPTLRNAVKARALSPLDALGAYSQGITTQLKLFLIQTESVTLNDQQIQAVGLIATVQAREQLSQEDALLSGMLAAKRITARNRAAFADLAATRQADVAYADYILSPANLATLQRRDARVRDPCSRTSPASSRPSRRAPRSPSCRSPRPNGSSWPARCSRTSTTAASRSRTPSWWRDHQNSHSAWVRVAVTSGIALLGLLITVAVHHLVARGIIRRLGGLERSARTLAEDQLPDVIARLRRGEDVDMAAEAPPLRTGGDEIGQVGQAFELVRQTAVRSAVEEARLRQGLNDVFRSLARRSQSLLHRQLTLLDQMERRATDPEALDDLFRLDHLTTRMRRHAEGLVILAGAPPGRSWSSPVRMVDVMRGAIAEVEDYARVSVATRSQAALAGSAVADVIHLLAELIENATTLSPPYTSVRVAGDTVANGFAIEVEDRGLGMSAQRLAELNERLASPPEFNPSDSEQLGLFVVSQLAKRHGIRVTLKASPYGGTAAIVLIPQHLVVTEEAFRAGLPGEPAAIGPASVGPLRSGSASVGRAAQGTNGNHTPAEMAGPARSAGRTAAGPELGGRGQELPGVPGVRISGPLRRSPGGTPEGDRRGVHHAAPRGGEAVASRAGEHPDFDVFTPRRGPETGDAAVPAEAGASSGPSAGPSAGPGGAGAPQAEAAAFVSSPPYPGSAPYPGAGTAPYADQLAPFPGWTGRSVAGGSVTPEAPAGPAGGAAGPGGPAGPTTPMTPVASSRPARPSGPPWELSRQTGPLPAVPADGEPGAQPDGERRRKGLPRRVRQASMAPQLRDNPPRRQTSPAPRSGPGQRADAGRDPPDHVRAAARLARGAVAADDRLGSG